MSTHFRITQENGLYSVYSVDNPVEPEEQYPTKEQAERYVTRGDRTLGALDKLHDEFHIRAERLAKEYHIDYRKAVAWLALSMMKLDHEIWGGEPYPDSVTNPD